MDGDFIMGLLLGATLCIGLLILMAFSSTNYAEKACIQITKATHCEQVWQPVKEKS